MFGIFDKKKDTARPSIKEVVLGEKKKTSEEIKKQLFDALAQTEAHKQLYATNAQRAINKAKKAIASGDEAGKRIAYSELKFAYGVYQYMSTLHNAFRTLKSQQDMQEMTEGFAFVVNSLSKIRIPANSLDFDRLTATALRGFKSVDMSGLDKMLQQLMEGSIQATNVSGASDSFLDKLISGEVTLDTPYTAPAAVETEAASDTQTAGQPAEDASAADLIAMLDAINTGFRNT